MPQLVIDKKSYSPFGFVRSAIFVTKEYLHRKRDRDFRTDYVQGEQKKQAQAHLENLQRDGILILPAYFKGEALKKLQDALEKAVKDKPAKGVNDAWRDENALGADSAILHASLDNFLLEIIGGYYGKTFGVGRGDATRLMPTPPLRSESYQWHHDTRGRQIHMMVLLNDVTPKGQRTSYLRGSHNTYYDRFRGEGHGSRFESDLSNDPTVPERVVELVGPAGTVGLFDSNGLHSGNRNDQEKRDCLLFCYVSHKRHYKPVSMRRSDFMGIPPAKRDLIAMNPRLVIRD